MMGVWEGAELSRDLLAALECAVDQALADHRALQRVLSAGLTRAFDPDLRLPAIRTRIRVICTDGAISEHHSKVD